METKRRIPVEIGSPVHHMVYGDGKCVGKNEEGIQVQFDTSLETLSFDDYEYDWIINPHFSFDLIENGLLDQTTLFENIHIMNIQDEVNEKIEDLIQEIQEYKNETAFFDQTHLDVLNDTRKLYREIAKKPYFGRIDIVSGNDENLGRSYYIGEHDYEDQILHWANPLALPYHLPYLYNNKSEAAYLNLKRIFEIKKRQIVKIKDMDLSDIARPVREEIQEAFEATLPDIIEENREEEIHNITRSLQKEQYAIISEKKETNMLVLGVAGSGKTMVMAHHIAYLSYNDEDYDQDDVYVITTSKLLKKEIERIDVEMHESHFFTASEFHRFLIEKISLDHQLTLLLKDVYLPDTLLENNLVKRLYSKDMLEMLENLYQQIKHQTGIYYDKFQKYETERMHVLEHHRQSLETDCDEKQYNEIKRLLENLSYEDLMDYKEQLEKSYSKYNIEQQQENIKQSLLEKYHKKYPSFALFNTYQIDGLVNQYHADIHWLDAILESIHFILEDKEYVKAKEQYYQLSNLYKSLSANQKQFSFSNKAQTGLNKIKKEMKAVKNKIIDMQKEVAETLKSYEISLKGYDLNQLRERLWYIKDAYLKAYQPILEYQRLLDGKVQIDASSLTDNGDTNLLKRYFCVRSLLDEPDLLKGKSHQNVEKVIDQLMHYRIDIVAFMHSYLPAKASMTVSNSKEDAINRIIKYVLFQIRENLKITDHYEYELFYILYLLALEYKDDHIDQKYIYIDEVQDFSYAELSLYSRLYQNSVFNYFGDLHQTLSLRGLSKEELMTLTNHYQLYSINYNYRNAKAISEYLNKEFNVENQSIDLKGQVHYVKSVQDFVYEITRHPVTSTAIIISDASSKSMIKGFEYYPNMHYVDEQHLELKDDSINVIKTSLSKGLEFKNVLVVHHRMNEKEKYVSCSRALENLYIIQ